MDVYDRGPAWSTASQPVARFAAGAVCGNEQEQAVGDVRVATRRQRSHVDFALGGVVGATDKKHHELRGDGTAH